MRILIVGKSFKDYLAKCHEAFRTGLRASFDTRCFGKGYPGYWPFLRSYEQIIRRVFPDSPPDLLVADYYYPYDKCGFEYLGIADVRVLKCLIFGDYWEATSLYYDQFINFIQKSGVDYILSYFPQPIDIWANTPIADRFIYLPPCYDPTIFNDWQMEKIYDVGFLAAGTSTFSDFYPERFAIHQKLLKHKWIKYLWAPHPGWKKHTKHSPLVGPGFSRAINSCRLFLTTGGIHRNAHAKYVEILASRTVLMADEPVGAERIGLEDGFNYVKVSLDDVMDKIDYYLAAPDLCNKIAENGYITALRYHTCYTRAVEFHEAIRERSNSSGVRNKW